MIETKVYAICYHQGTKSEEFSLIEVQVGNQESTGVFGLIPFADTL